MIIFLFVVATLVMVLIPVVPALIEWRYPTDALPLRVVRDYDGSADHFATRFRAFIEDRMGQAFREGESTPDVVHWGELPGGGATLLIGRNQTLPTHLRAKGREIDAVIAALGSVTLPQNVFAKGEIYARGDITVSDRTACRAVLSEHDLTLGNGCAVIRWAHAQHDIVTGARARLWGRLTAGHQITLGEDSVFTRLHAPRIVTGLEPVQRVSPVLPERMKLAMPPDVHFHSIKRWMTRKSMTVPAYTVHDGDLIAEGALLVETGSYIVGSLKTHKTLVIERDCVIEGSIIAMHDLLIEEGSLIVGPVVGEATVTIEKGCVIGSPDRPTTITAPRIRLAHGVVVYGSIWSREDGKVLMNPGPKKPLATAGRPLQLETVA